MGNQQLEINIKPDTLFNYSEENNVYKKKGIEAYNIIQQNRIKKPAQPGVGFNIINKLLALNSEANEYIKINISNNDDPIRGLRTANSIEFYNLNISSNFYYNSSDDEYLEELKNNLFLSNDINEVKSAINSSVFSAYIAPCNNTEVIKIAFDGHFVTTYYCKERNLKIFNKFIKLINDIKKTSNKIRVGLILANKDSIKEEAFGMFLAQGVEIDEMFFLGNLDKKDIIRKFSPDIYFYNGGVK